MPDCVNMTDPQLGFRWFRAKAHILSELQKDLRTGGDEMVLKLEKMLVDYDGASSLMKPILPPSVSKLRKPRSRSNSILQQLTKSFRGSASITERNEDTEDHISIIEEEDDEDDGFMDLSNSLVKNFKLSRSPSMHSIQSNNPSTLSKSHYTSTIPSHSYHQHHHSDLLPSQQQQLTNPYPTPTDEGPTTTTLTTTLPTTQSLSFSSSSSPSSSSSSPSSPSSPSLWCSLHPSHTFARPNSVSTVLASSTSLSTSSSELGISESIPEISVSHNNDHGHSIANDTTTTIASHRTLHDLYTAVCSVADDLQSGPRAKEFVSIMHKVFSMHAQEEEVVETSKNKKKEKRTR